MTGRARRELEETQDEIEDLETEIETLEAELREAAAEITRKWGDILPDSSSEELAPRRTDVKVRLVALVWLPAWQATVGGDAGPRTATIAAYSEPETP